MTPFLPSDARVLWCLRRRSSDVRCVLFTDRTPIEARILQGEDVVLVELFGEERLAAGWAKAYGDRLKQQGWFDVPTDA